MLLVVVVQSVGAVLKGMTGRMDVRNGNDDDDDTRDDHGVNQNGRKGYRLFHHGMSMPMSMSRRRGSSTTTASAAAMPR